jgi:hypothetical protein
MIRESILLLKKLLSYRKPTINQRTYKKQLLQTLSDLIILTIELRIEFINNPSLHRPQVVSLSRVENVSL